MASSLTRVLEGAVSAAVHAGVEAATAPVQKSDYAIDSPRLRLVDSVLRLEAPLGAHLYYESNQLSCEKMRRVKEKKMTRYSRAH